MGKRNSSSCNCDGVLELHFRRTKLAQRICFLVLNLVALCRAIRLRFGCGFELCDANGLRDVKNTNAAKHRPVFDPPRLLVGSKESVVKAGQFHAAIRVTRNVAIRVPKLH